VATSVADGLGYGLDELALERARSFRFSPAHDAHGNAVATDLIWTFNFKPRQAIGPGQVAARGPLTGAHAARAPGSAPPLDAAATAQRAIKDLTPVERGQLCRVMIRVRGGVHADKCRDLHSRQEVLGNVMDEGRSRNGHTAGFLIGRDSPHSLYDQDLVTFEEGAVAYDHNDASGFIKLNALRLRTLAKRKLRAAKA